MANRYVRIHNKPEGFGEPGTMIGFSMSASLDVFELYSFAAYFKIHGQKLRELSHRDTHDKELAFAIGGVSAQYVEVQPPITDEQLDAIGQLCATHIDSSHNEGYLVDNRETSGPLRPFDPRGALVAHW